MANLFYNAFKRAVRDQEALCHSYWLIIPDFSQRFCYLLLDIFLSHLDSYFLVEAFVILHFGLHPVFGFGPLFVPVVVGFCKPCHEQTEIHCEMLVYGAQGEPYYCGKAIDEDLKERNENVYGQGEKNCNGKWFYNLFSGACPITSATSFGFLI